MSDAFPPPPPPPPPSGSGTHHVPDAGWAHSTAPVVNYASFGRRLGAAIVDWIVLSVAFRVSGATSSSLIVPLLQLLGGFAYVSYLDGVRGQTLGKMATKIKVIDIDTGDPIGLGRGAGRYFGKLVSLMGIFLGYLWMIWDPKSQTWHDKMIRSVVVDL